MEAATPEKLLPTSSRSALFLCFAAELLRNSPPRRGKRCWPKGVLLVVVEADSDGACLNI